MLQLHHVIEGLKHHRRLLFDQFGVKSILVFGSMAKGEQTESSDIDLCVETVTPNPFLIIDLKEYISNLFGRKVDIVRSHSNMNPLLKSEIERYGIKIL